VIFFVTVGQLFFFIRLKRLSFFFSLSLSLVVAIIIIMYVCLCWPEKSSIDPSFTPCVSLSLPLFSSLPYFFERVRELLNRQAGSDSRKDNNNTPV
jgi:hypothetical protein